MPNQNQNNLKDSILLSVKKLLLIEPDYNIFDDNIILNINTVLSSLTQMGVGIKGGLTIKDSSATWEDFLPELNGNEEYTFNQVQSYVYIKVRLLFDPPQTSALLDSLNRQASELEYRLYTQSGGY